MYKNDVATQPLQRLCVGDCNVSCSVSFCGTCRDGYYCFTVESSDEGGKKTGSNVFCSDDTAEQERWIQALINAGASFTENQNELVKDAHSFYEFKVSHGSGMGSAMGSSGMGSGRAVIELMLCVECSPIKLRLHRRVVIAMMHPPFELKHPYAYNTGP